MSFSGFPQPETFTQFVTNAPASTGPTSADLIALIQGGVTKKVAPWFGGLAVPTTKVTAGASYNYTASDMLVGVLKTVGSATSLVLPSSGLFLGRMFAAADWKGDANTNPITVTAAGGNTFDGGATSVVLGAWASVGFLWTGTFFKKC